MDGVQQLVRSLALDWLHGARSLLVLYSADAIGDGWRLCAQSYLLALPPTQVILVGVVSPIARQAYLSALPPTQVIL